MFDIFLPSIFRQFKVCSPHSSWSCCFCHVTLTHSELHLDSGSAYYFLVYKWWYIELHITVVKGNLCFYSSTVSLLPLAKWLWHWSLLCRFIYLSPVESQRVQIPQLKPLTLQFRVSHQQEKRQTWRWLKYVLKNYQDLPGKDEQRFLSHTLSTCLCDWFEFPAPVCTDLIISPAALRFLSENKPRRPAEATSRPWA